MKDRLQKVWRSFSRDPQSSIPVLSKGKKIVIEIILKWLQQIQRLLVSFRFLKNPRIWSENVSEISVFFMRDVAELLAKAHCTSERTINFNLSGDLYWLSLLPFSQKKCSRRCLDLNQLHEEREPYPGQFWQVNTQWRYKKDADILNTVNYSSLGYPTVLMNMNGSDSRSYS